MHITPLPPPLQGYPLWKLPRLPAPPFPRKWTQPCCPLRTVTSTVLPIHMVQDTSSPYQDQGASPAFHKPPQHSGPPSIDQGKRFGCQPGTFHGIVLQRPCHSFPCSKSLPLYKSPILPPSKHPHTIMVPPPCLTDAVKSCSCIFFCASQKSSVWSQDLKLDLICPQHLFPVFQCLCSFAHLGHSFYWPFCDI